MEPPADAQPPAVERHAVAVCDLAHEQEIAGRILLLTEQRPHHLAGRIVEVHPKMGQPVGELGADVMEKLSAYAWPGNVRELENAIEYAVAVGKGQTIVPEDLPSEILVTDAGPRLQIREPAQQDSEQDRIMQALEHAHWRREDAAKELGMSRTTLWRRMRELGLE